MVIQGEKRSKRLVAQLKDRTGSLELCWFQGIHWVENNLQTGKQYLVYGKVGFFNGRAQITHPEIEPWTPIVADGKDFLEPVYPATEKLKARGLSGKQLGKLTKNLLELTGAKDIPEIIPAPLIKTLGLESRFDAFSLIHFPKSRQQYDGAVYR